MPRIAHVVSSPEGVGGAERVVASLVHGTLERGWEPLVINPFSRDPQRSELAEICAPATYVGQDCRSWRELPRLRHWLQSVIRGFAPQLLHAHLFHAEVAIASLQLPGRTKSVLTHHHGDHFNYLDERRKQRLDRWAGARFDRVVAISEWVRQFLLERYGYRDRSVELIRNGWTGHPLPHQGSGDTPTAIYVANFRPQKGHLDLIEAFHLVLREVPSAKLILVGVGPLVDPVRRAAVQAGIADSVDFRGSVADIWPEYAKADVFVQTSLYEPQGIAAMEAMAAGLPVVATDVGGVREMVEHGTSGLLAPASDRATLAKNLIRLLNSPEERKAMGAEGQDLAQNFTAGGSVDRYFALYESMIEEAS